MSDVLDRLKKYKESCLDDDGYVINGEAENLVFKAIEEIERYQEVLRFYGDRNKYFYAKQDHPNTRLAEDGGKLARNALSD